MSSSNSESDVDPVLPADSPYIGLVNLCYQLRSENEMLTKTVALKSAEIEACKAQIELFKQRTANDTSEEHLEKQIKLENERLELMQQNYQLQNELSNKNSRPDTTREDRVFDQIVRTEAAIVLPIESAKCGASCKRLRSEIETFEYIQKQLERKLEEKLDKEMIQRDETETPQVKTIIMSGDDSLLRTYESIMGWNIVQVGNEVQLISDFSPDGSSIRFARDSETLSLVGEVDPEALAVLKLTQSIPSFMATCIINKSI